MRRHTASQAHIERHRNTGIQRGMHFTNTYTEGLAYMQTYFHVCVSSCLDTSSLSRLSLSLTHMVSGQQSNLMVLSQILFKMIWFILCLVFLSNTFVSWYAHRCKFGLFWVALEAPRMIAGNVFHNMGECSVRDATFWYASGEHLCAHPLEWLFHRNLGFLFGASRGTKHDCVWYLFWFRIWRGALSDLWASLGVHLFCSFIGAVILQKHWISFGGLWSYIAARERICPARSLAAPWYMTEGASTRTTWLRFILTWVKAICTREHDDIFSPLIVSYEKYMYFSMRTTNEN